jgi:hypothetical protein
MAIIDTRSIKTTEQGGLRGKHAHQKLKRIARARTVSPNEERLGAGVRRSEARRPPKRK